MKIIQRNDVGLERLPGRVIQKLIGKDAFSPSGKMSMGFARYSEESGNMEPHQHAEEICYVINVKNGWIRYGQRADDLGDPVMLKVGMTIHNPAFEWHAFGFEKSGFVEILYFYGQVDQIRPEDMDK